MEVPGKTMSSEGNIDGTVKVCEPCQGDNITTRANGICKDCGEFMCNVCFRQRLRVKLCRHHMLVDADLSHLSSPDGKDVVVKCSQHNGETIRFYCRKHEVVGCGDCMILEHNACKSEYIKDIAEDFQQKEEFRTLKDNVAKLSSVNQENMKSVQESTRDNKVMLEKAICDIRNFRADINTYLDKAETGLISEVKEITAENDKLLNKLEQNCKLISSRIETIKQKLDTEVYGGNELYINTVECKSSVSDLEYAIAIVQSKNITKFEFVCDERLQTSLSSTKGFGSFGVSSVSLHNTADPTEKTCKERETNARQSHINDNKKIKVSSVTAKRSTAMIAIGSRVCYNNPSGYMMTGTVNSVHTDGSVNVNWDDGRRGGPHRVGAAVGELSLT